MTSKQVEFSRKWVPNNTENAFWYPVRAILHTFCRKRHSNVITLFQKLDTKLAQTPLLGTLFSRITGSPQVLVRLHPLFC